MACNKGPPVSSSLPSSPPPPSSSPPAAHPFSSFLRLLSGTWVGTGSGFYPTISSFSFEEELEFRCFPDKPILSFSQSSWLVNSNRSKSLHFESGFLRFPPNRGPAVEFLVAANNGITEVCEGQAKQPEQDRQNRVDDGTLLFSLVFHSSSLGLTASAPPVAARSTERVLELYQRPDDSLFLLTRLAMSTSQTVELTAHLTNRLEKKS